MSRWDVTEQASLTVPDQTPEQRTVLYNLLLLTYFGLVKQKKKENRLFTLQCFIVDHLDRTASKHIMFHLLSLPPQCECLCLQEYLHLLIQHFASLWSKVEILLI